MIRKADGSDISRAESALQTWWRFLGHSEEDISSQQRSRPSAYQTQIDGMQIVLDVHGSQVCTVQEDRRRWALGVVTTWASLDIRESDSDKIVPADIERWAARAVAFAETGTFSGAPASATLPQPAAYRLVTDDVDGLTFYLVDPAYKNYGSLSNSVEDARVFLTAAEAEAMLKERPTINGRQMKVA